MRIYDNCYELVSEMSRDLWEMGIKVVPRTYQNKVIEGNDEFITKEIQNYVYTLTSLDKEDALFVFSEPNSKKWVDAEFGERVNPLPVCNPGEAYKLRFGTWEEFLNDAGQFDYTYNERISRNLARIEGELQRNPDTRQAWLPIFWESDPAFIGGKRRVPCSLGYFFSVREGKLNMTYIQRSADMVMHLGNDIYLAWRMMAYVAAQLKYEVGFLTHHIFSLHSYQRDWKALENGISQFKNIKG